MKKFFLIIVFHFHLFIAIFEIPSVGLWSLWDFLTVDFPIFNYLLLGFFLQLEAWLKWRRLFTPRFGIGKNATVSPLIFPFIIVEYQMKFPPIVCFVHLNSIFFLYIIFSLELCSLICIHKNAIETNCCWWRNMRNERWIMKIQKMKQNQRIRRDAISYHRMKPQIKIPKMDNSPALSEYKISLGTSYRISGPRRRRRKKNGNGVSDWKFKKDFKPLDRLLCKELLLIAGTESQFFSLLHVHYFFLILLIFICARFHHPWNVSFFLLCFFSALLRCHEVCFMRMHYEYQEKWYGQTDKHSIFHALWLFDYQNGNFARKWEAKKMKKFFYSTYGLCFSPFRENKKGNLVQINLWIFKNTF